MNLDDVKEVVIRVVCAECKGEKLVRTPQLPLGSRDRGLVHCPVCAGSGLTQTTISIAQFRTLVHGKPPSLANGSTMQTIIAVVAKYFGVSTSDVAGKMQYKRIALARHLAMWLCYNRLPVSYPDLARVFNRDHTTALMGVRRIETARHEQDSKSAGVIRTYLAELEAILAPAVSVGDAGIQRR